MLNFTKKVFEKTIELYGGGKVANVIVTKQHIIGPGTPLGTVAAAIGRQAFIDVVVISGLDFYADTSDITVLGSLSDTGVSCNGNGIVTYQGLSPLVTTDNVVIYIMADTYLSAKTLFRDNGIKLISIDYVGSSITDISTEGCDTTYLIDVEASNIYNGVNAILNDTDFSGDKYALFGNHNDISLNPGAFTGTTLKKIVLPASDETYTIPANCFAGCTSLIEVVIPDCVTAIGAGAFSGCTSLRYVYIGSGVTSIGAKAFNGCSNIDEFIVDSSNPNFYGLKGCLLTNGQTSGTYKMLFANKNWWNNQYDTNIKNKYVYTTDHSMSSTWTWSTIDPNCTIHSTLTQVDMVFQDSTFGSPLTVETIKGTPRTGSLVTSSNLNTIRTYNSGQYNNMHDYFYAPVYYYITEIMEDACSGDTQITNVNLSRYKSLTLISQNAFKGCTGLTTLTVPAEPTTILSYCDMSGSAMTHLTIGASAFEGCTNLTSFLHLYHTSSYGNKAFYGCTALTSLAFPNRITAMGTQVFSNTPNLASIVMDNTGPGGDIIYWGTGNAIMTSVGGYTVLVVGCKNTSLVDAIPNISSSRIGDYAFYGCTTYNPSNTDEMYLKYGNNGYINSIGNYAFYGCTGITNLFGIYTSNIGQCAFYGCTGISDLEIGSDSNGAAIASKAFAKCNMQQITLAGPITSLANDAFEDGIILNIKAMENGSSCIYRNSEISYENSVLKKHPTDPTNSTSLLKSGSGKAIVNTTYNVATKKIVEIGPGAFTGVNLNTTGNTVIHVPSTVTTINKSAFANSKVNDSVTGDNTQMTLRFDLAETSVPNVINNGVSMSLLWSIGAKYFRKIVTDTYQMRLATANHWYFVDANTGYLHIYEQIAGVSTPNRIATIEYISGNIQLTIYAAVLPGYDRADTRSHIRVLQSPIRLNLMAYGELYNTAEQAVYLDNTIQPGSSWLGYVIPNDWPTTSATQYQPITTLGNGAISDCKWVDIVESGRRLAGENLFSGCTKLLTVRAMNPYSGSVCDASIFDGTIQKGMFNGCTLFTGFTTSVSASTYTHPIVFKENCFKNTAMSDPEFISLGTTFEASSFENTNYMNINLNSASSIDPTAFSGCNLSIVKADSPCGYYFTGFGCIIDKNAIIVVGGRNYDLDSMCDGFSCAGIGDNAFSGRQYNDFNVSITNKNGFTVGKNAFANSNIISYNEDGCQNTQFRQGSFKDCTSLITVNIGSGAVLAESTFEGCRYLENVDIAGKVNMPISVFAGCVSLQSVSIASNVAKDAFKGCTGLKSLELCYSQSDTIVINPQAFIGCPLTTFKVIDGYDANTTNYSFKQNNIYSADKRTIVIGNKNSEYFFLDNIKTIGAHAYNGRGLIGEFVIPGSVTRIEDYAFANNPGITKISIPPTVEYIGDHAFDGCSNLLQATLPDSCEYIGEGAFKGCPLTYGFNSNTIDEDYFATSVASGHPLDGPSAIGSSLDLTNCTAYSSVTDNAFQDSEIEIVRLPMTCTDVGKYAFAGCTHMTELHISSTAFGVDNSAFQNCGMLRDIYFHKRCTLTGVGVNWCYGVGTQATDRYIHIPPSMNNSTYLNSNFIFELVHSWGFIVVVDM